LDFCAKDRFAPPVVDFWEGLTEEPPPCNVPIILNKLTHHGQINVCEVSERIRINMVHLSSSLYTLNRIKMN